MARSTGTGTPAPRRVRRALIVTASVTVIAVALGLLIDRTEGYAATSVTPDPQSVWVTNSAEYMVGRVDTQIDELDSAALLDSPAYDVLQDGRRVVVVDTADHRLRSLNVATVSLGPPIRIPDDAAVVLGGDVLAVADRTTGAVRVATADHVGASQLTGADPAFTAAPGVALAAATDGTVAAVAPGSTAVLLLRPGADTPTRVPLDTPVSGPSASTPTVAPPTGDTAAGAPAQPAPSAVTVTLVGDVPVVLDRAKGRLLVGGRSLPLPGGAQDAVLQQPGPQADSVLVSTRTALLRIALADGTVQTVASGVTGAPAAPVWLSGCAHAAWDGARPTYLRWCGSTPSVRPVPHATGHPDGPAGLVFRVNGDTVVLNDVVTGNVWVADETMQLINNWEQVAPQRNDAVGDTQQPHTGAATELTLSRTDCSGGMSPPTAVDDDLGIRAGHPVILPVMANDSVSDCSVTRIDEVSPLPPDLGSVHIVAGGTALQVTTDADVTGTLPALTYRLSDGAGHTAEARVALHVVPAGSTPAPRKLRDSATVLALGGTATTNVLTDWISPAGDPLFLTGARSTDAAESVSFTADGSITVRDPGSGSPGKHAVAFTVSDGTNTVAGTLTVQVISAADLVPVPSGVYAATSIGTPVSLHPLAGVLSIGPDPLRLTGVTSDPHLRQPGQISIEPDLDTGTVVATADAPGTYYLTFGVASGQQSADGVIRVDVTAPGDDQAPVPVVDTAYLPEGGTVRSDLVANDIDPFGGVLAVQQVSLDDGSPLVVTMADMHIATISASAPLPPAGAWFSYSVAGSGPPATGWVHVIGVPPAAQQTPLANPISLTVRAGDAITVPASTGAQDPGGAALTVQPFDPLPVGQGLLFASGDEIRYLAPRAGLDQPVSTTYTVTNTQGRSASAPLQIRVVPTGENHPPGTPPVTVARVFTGGTVTVALPLAGIDPDGDWAIVTGIATPPDAGTARVVGPNAVQFTAPDAPGTVTVGYTVTDPQGAHSTGTVVVGVVDRPDVVLPPAAPDLTATVAPGASLAVDVLDAVTDPAGAPVRFADPGLTGPGGSAGVTGRISGSTVVVTAGARPTVVPLTYTVQNDAGLTASGTITVTVSPDARPAPPVARDAYVTSGMLATDGRSARVDLAGLVAGPDGSAGGLTLHIPPIDGRAVTATGALAVRVAVTGVRQVLAYQVSDRAGLTASAFIVVPGRNEILPSGSLAGSDGHAAPTAPASIPPPGAAARGTQPTPAGQPRATGTTAPPPPLVVSAIQVALAAGQSRTVQLTGLVQQAGRYRALTFTGLRGAGHGISADLSGSRLTVRAGIGVPRGTTADLTVTVADGTHPPVTGHVLVTVTDTTAPAPTVPDRRAQTAPRTAVTVNMLAAATNPLAARGRLTLTSTRLTGGHAAVRFTRGGAVTVTPAAGESGTVTVLATATDPAGRHASGTLTVTVLGRPDPPSNVAVAGTGDGSVTLRWSTPDDHGSPIRGYTVTAPGVGFDCGTTTCTVTGLTNGQAYVFTVRARNGIGESGPSAAVGPVTPDVAPGAPGRPTLTAGDRQLGVRWAAPAGSSPVDHYLVAISPAPPGGPATRTAAGTMATITGLVNGTAYTVTVTGVSVTGVKGPPSAPSAPGTPLGRPGAPGTPTLDFTQAGGANTIDVSWPAPANDGGDPRLTYTVHWTGSGGAGSGTVDAGTARTATITGVRLGSTYTVTVVAGNPAGSSAPGAPATITPTTAPEQVPAMTARPTGTAGQVALTWQAPADGGRQITSYQYRYSTAGGSASAWSPTSGTSTAGGSATGTSTTVTGLPDGAAYTFVVRACNGSSSCGVASPAASADPYGPPGTIGNLSAYGTGTSGQVKATWSAPSTGGRAIATYQYRYRKGSGSYTGWRNSPNGTAPSMALTGFTDGADYTFQVRAITQTRAGDPTTGHTGAASNADVATPYRPPDQMAAPTGSNVTQTSITLNWRRPFDGGRAINQYQYSRNGGAWTSAGTGTSHTVTGLSSGTTYRFRIRACNAAACGTASSARSIATTAKPSVALVHGAPISNSQCNVDCYYFKIQYANLKAGRYTVTIYLDGSAWRTYTWTLGTSGSKQATSYAGRNPSRTAWVKLVGPSGTVTSPKRTWP